MNIRIEQGDALEVMATLESGSIHCVITDPAYWTLNKWRSMGTTTRLGGGRGGDKDPDRFFETIDLEYLQVCVREWGRLLPKNGHCWVMCDDETQMFLLGYVREGGETPFNYSKLFPVIKRTTDGGGYRQGMGYHGRCSHEFIVLLEKGRRRFSDENWPDVFEFPWTGDAETRALTPSGKPFPTAKPVALYRRLVELSSSFGETVLDCFSGSGTLGAACTQMQRAAILIDADPRAIATAQRRLIQPVLDAFADSPITGAQYQALRGVVV